MQSIFADLGEELAIALLAAEETDNQHGRPVGREQGTDTVELGGEDPEHNEGERELRECGADVGSLESALGSADLDDFGWGQHNRSGAVEAEVVAVRGTTLGRKSV